MDMRIEVREGSPITECLESPLVQVNHGIFSHSASRVMGIEA